MGGDADLVAFDPDETFMVDPARLLHRHPVTPYAGRTLTGRVRQTWLRGTALLDAGSGAPVVSQLAGCLNGTTGISETDPMDEQLLPDLLRLRGSVVAASDEFFAAKENLIKPDAPTFVPETYDAKGQVYDGWETRRRRGPGGTLPDRVRPGLGDRPARRARGGALHRGRHGVLHRQLPAGLLGGRRARSAGTLAPRN